MAKLATVTVPFTFHPVSELPDDEETLLLAFLDGEYEIGYHKEGHWHLQDAATLSPDDEPCAWARFAGNPFTLEPQNTKTPSCKTKN